MVLLFRATGISHSDAVASVVQCTNRGATDAYVAAHILDYDGSFVCTVTDSEVAPGGTTTLGTGPTMAYFEDFTCPAPSSINQGSLLIFGDSTGSTDLICTVQVLDSGSRTPSFLTTLDLFDPNGTPIELQHQLIFADGFESGDLSAWSLTVD